MDINTARELFSESQRLTDPRELGHTALFEDFHASPPDRRARYREAAVVLFRDGTTADRENALHFWGGTGHDEASTEAISDAWLTSEDGRLGRILGESPSVRFNAATAERLAARFVADPVAARRLATNLVWKVRTHPVVTAWESLIASENDIARLRELFDAGTMAGLETRYLQVLGTKPAEIEDKVRALLPARWRSVRPA